MADLGGINRRFSAPEFQRQGSLGNLPKQRDRSISDVGKRTINTSLRGKGIALDPSTNQIVVVKKRGKIARFFSSLFGIKGAKSYENKKQDAAARLLTTAKSFQEKAKPNVGDLKEALQAAVYVKSDSAVKSAFKKEVDPKEFEFSVLRKTGEFFSTIENQNPSPTFEDIEEVVQLLSDEKLNLTPDLQVKVDKYSKIIEDRKFLDTLNSDLEAIKNGIETKQEAIDGLLHGNDRQIQQRILERPGLDYDVVTQNRPTKDARVKEFLELPEKVVRDPKIKTSDLQILANAFNVPTPNRWSVSDTVDVRLKISKKVRSLKGEVTPEQKHSIEQVVAKDLHLKEQADSLEKVKDVKKELGKYLEFSHEVVKDLKNLQSLASTEGLKVSDPNISRVLSEKKGAIKEQILLTNRKKAYRNGKGLKQSINESYYGFTKVSRFLISGNLTQSYDIHPELREFARLGDQTINEL